MDNLFANKGSLPHLQFLFLCDNIVQHEDRQIDVTGLLSHVLDLDLPPLHVAPLQITTTLVVGIYSEDSFRAYALSVTTQDPDGNQAPLHSSQIGFTNGEYSPIKYETYDLTFFKPGIYWFNAYLDDRLVGRYPLVIGHTPMSNS